MYLSEKLEPHATSDYCATTMISTVGIDMKPSPIGIVGDRIAGRSLRPEWAVSSETEDIREGVV